MKAFKERRQNRSNPVPLQAREQSDLKNQDDLIDQFPLPRYFQVHFQHVHENADTLRREIIQLKHYTCSLEAKLDKLLALLNVAPEKLT